MLVSRGHMGGSCTILDDITDDELQKISEAIKKLPNKIIIANQDSIPSRLKAWRELRKYSLMDVERGTGISNSYLSQLESGKIKSPSFITVVKICKFYHVRLIIN